MQLIATAALFLAAKSEETPCPLNNVLRASSELYHKQDLSLLTYLLPVVSITGPFFRSATPFCPYVPSCKIERKLIYDID